ncbi:MAG: peptidoglycan-binding protein [Leptolyngbya sp. Prado105]|jgi:peptidoglycan hydrolase-like protein with peptidoglycan-binding domain|nr:peptidoglycan-binding protein [Leptolyngbya sp. Prado105]
MPVTSLQDLRENLDGLGYYLGPRGLDGLGNSVSACDRDILGAINCDTTSLRVLANLDDYTRAAILQYQLDSNMAATGNDGSELRTAIDKTVKILQNNLKLVLKINIELSGNYRRATYNAVKTYQKSRKLPVTGIATITVRRRLNDEARGVVSPTPTPTSELEELRKLKSELITLKQSLQSRQINDQEFIREVFARLP